MLDNDISLPSSSYGTPMSFKKSSAGLRMTMAEKSWPPSQAATSWADGSLDDGNLQVWSSLCQHVGRGQTAGTCTDDDNVDSAY